MVGASVGWSGEEGAEDRTQSLSHMSSKTRKAPSRAYVAYERCFRRTSICGYHKMTTTPGREELEVLWSSNGKNMDKRVRFDAVFFPFDAGLEMTLFEGEADRKEEGREEVEVVVEEEEEEQKQASLAQPVPGLMFGIRPPTSSRKRKVDELFFAKRVSFKPRFDLGRPALLAPPSPCTPTPPSRLSQLVQREEQESSQFDQKLQSMLK